jgi:hypothetical protein
MTDTRGLVERLRVLADDAPDWLRPAEWEPVDLIREAADALEAKERELAEVSKQFVDMKSLADFQERELAALRESNAALAAALRPLAEVEIDFGNTWRDDSKLGPKLTVGHVRAARAAIAAAEGQTTPKHRVPEPDFCHHPRTCRDLDRCPIDPTCRAAAEQK